MAQSTSIAHCYHNVLLVSIGPGWMRGFIEQQLPLLHMLPRVDVIRLHQLRLVHRNSKLDMINYFN